MPTAPGCLGRALGAHNQTNPPSSLAPPHTQFPHSPPPKNEFLGGGGEGGVHIRPNTHTHPPTPPHTHPRSEEMDFEPGMEELLMDEVDDAAMEDEEEGFLTRSRSRWAGVGVGVALLCHSGGWNAMGAGLQCALLGGARSVEGGCGRPAVLGFACALAGGCAWRPPLSYTVPQHLHSAGPLQVGGWQERRWAAASQGRRRGGRRWRAAQAQGQRSDASGVCVL